MAGRADPPEEHRGVVDVVGVVVVVDGACCARLTGGMVQTLVQASVDLGHEAMSVDDVEADDDATYMATMITVATTATRAAWVR